MAPEQIMNKPSPASDQYALGVVVYEWLCGIRPFHGDVFNIFFQHLQTPPLALREQLSTIPPLVEVVVLKALAKDPKQRFASVKAFANALEQATKAEQDIPSIIPTITIASGFTTHKAEVDTKSGQILPPTQPIPLADQSSLSPGVVAPDNQLPTVNSAAHLLSSTIPPSKIVPLPNQQVTSLASVSQSRGIHLPKRNLLRIGIFLIGLAFAFYFSNTFNSGLFLPILFTVLAIVSLIDAASSGSVNGAFIGLYSFVGLLGLALCFLIGFWPWILVIPGMALIIYFLGKLWHLSTPPLRLLRNQGLWFWIILTFIIISLISGGWRSFNGLSSVHSSFNQRQIVEQPINYTVNGQATIVINDPNGNVTITEGQSNNVIIQPVNGNSFPGNPNDIQQGISQNGNSISAEIQNSEDLLVCTIGLT